MPDESTVWDPCKSFTARNEQEEQEEKREIKRRLTRKVRSNFDPIMTLL